MKTTSHKTEADFIQKWKRISPNNKGDINPKKDDLNPQKEDNLIQKIKMKSNLTKNRTQPQPNYEDELTQKLRGPHKKMKMISQAATLKYILLCSIFSHPFHSALQKKVELN